MKRSRAGQYVDLSKFGPANGVFDPNKDNNYLWDHMVCCTIKPTGAWEIKHASSRQYTSLEPDKNTAPLIDNIKCSGDFAAKDEKGRVDIGRALGIWLLSNIPYILSRS
jgi:hypothetical protein